MRPRGAAPFVVRTRPGRSRVSRLGRMHAVQEHRGARRDGRGARAREQQRDLRRRAGGGREGERERVGAGEGGSVGCASEEHRFVDVGPAVPRADWEVRGGGGTVVGSQDGRGKRQTTTPNNRAERGRRWITPRTLHGKRQTMTTRTLAREEADDGPHPGPLASPK